ncbi:hypothetical protein LR48_Vigan04g095500 [Vigna angularis]|uniref:Uncharacterized protein n=1 Tax=Phaseolus angularis TaxID=3914 RepID=A0A0L9UDY3_PHAAN|nr:hypothetical protein LR48_Vigan04g095500 [Vigna angularis]
MRKREREQPEGGNPFSRFQPSKEHPWEAVPTSEGLRGGSGWASGERGVLAARSGRGSEKLLRLQGDLDLHVWEEIDPKIYKEVFKSILLVSRVRLRFECHLLLREESLRSRGDRSEVAMEDGSGRLLLRAGYDDEL